MIKKVRWEISWRYSAPTGPDGRANQLWGSHTIHPTDDLDWDLDLKYWIKQARTGKVLLKCGDHNHQRNVFLNEVDSIKVTMFIDKPRSYHHRFGVIEEDVTSKYFGAAS